MAAESTPDSVLENKLIEPWDKIRDAQKALSRAEQERDNYVVGTFSKEWRRIVTEIQAGKRKIAWSTGGVPNTPEQEATRLIFNDLVGSTHDRAFTEGEDGFEVISDASPDHHVGILQLEIEVQRSATEVNRLRDEERLNRLRYYLKVEEGRLAQSERDKAEEEGKDAELSVVEAELENAD